MLVHTRKLSSRNEAIVQFVEDALQNRIFENK